MAEVNGGALLARCLANEGVRFVFGLPSPEIDPLFAALEEHGIRLVPFRHESAGAHMAEGLYKTTGEGRPKTKRTPSFARQRASSAPPFTSAIWHLLSGTRSSSTRSLAADAVPLSPAKCAHRSIGPGFISSCPPYTAGARGREAETPRLRVDQSLYPAVEQERYGLSQKAAPSVRVAGTGSVAPGRPMMTAEPVAQVPGTWDATPRVLPPRRSTHALRGV